MPGIAGFAGRVSIARLDEAAERMTRVMRHETFYSSGTCSSDQVGIALGWAVQSGTFADRNPIWNERRDAFLVFCGEEFSDDSRLQSLRNGDGTAIGNHADYLLRWYEEKGPRFVEELNGSFSGVLVDLRRNEAILFNDRLGLGRVYVHEEEGLLWFSSEAKSILEMCPGTRGIDPVGLAEFASCGCALQNRSLFRGISLLPPASCWTIANGAVVKKSTYFSSKTLEQQSPLSESEFENQLDDTFARIVPKYFRGQQRIGMSLTGGLDGRMIMACDARPPGEMPSYTFGGPYRDCTDVTIARRIARECGQTHQVVAVGDDFLKQFDKLAERSVYLSDGAMDVSGAVELFANRRAREIAPVRMTGNYGSEILRYNVAFKAQPLDAQLFDEGYLALGGAAGATYQKESVGHPMTLIAFKQVPWHHFSRLSVEQSQLTMRSPYLDNELVALAYRSPVATRTSKTPALRFISTRKPGLGRIPTDRGLTYPPTPILTRLHNLYQEGIFRAEYMYDYGMPQWLARMDHAMSVFRPERLFLGRHKFYHFRVWYRDRLGEYLKDVLLSRRAQEREHLAPGQLERLVIEHTSGVRNHTAALHQALSIELIHRQLLERS